MNEVDFTNWLINKGIKKKNIGDFIYRLKRVERELGNCDLDEHYQNDKCSFLLATFANMGMNNNMKQFPLAQLPIGKYYMNTYRYSLKKYIKFKEDRSS